jgi:hypothetical protein
MALIMPNPKSLLARNSVYLRKDGADSTSMISTQRFKVGGGGGRHTLIWTDLMFLTWSYDNDLKMGSISMKGERSSVGTLSSAYNSRDE